MDSGDRTSIRLYINEGEVPTDGYKTSILRNEERLDHRFIDELKALLRPDNLYSTALH
jgi:hypothetical protein